MSRVLQVFSAVEFGINRPHSGSDHRHGGSKDSQHDGVSEFADHANDIQTRTVAIVIPATGVQSPRRRNTPATAAIK